MQSPENLSGKHLPLSSPKPFRLQTQQRPLESIKGSCKCPPRLALYQHLLPPPCLLWKDRHEQAHGESRLPPWETPGVKTKKGNCKSCSQAPRSQNPKRNLENRECVFPQNTRLAHTAVGTLQVHVQRGHRPLLQLLVQNVYDGELDCWLEEHYR